MNERTSQGFHLYGEIEQETTKKKKRGEKKTGIDIERAAVRG